MSLISACNEKKIQPSNHLKKDSHWLVSMAKAPNPLSFIHGFTIPILPKPKWHFLNAELNFPFQCFNICIFYCKDNNFQTMIYNDTKGLKDLSLNSNVFRQKGKWQYQKPYLYFFLWADYWNILIRSFKIGSWKT